MIILFQQFNWIKVAHSLHKLNNSSPPAEMSRDRLGWREFAGIFGCAVGSSVADGAVRPGVNGSQSGQGATELGFPGPALGQMQGEAAGRAGIRPAREKNRRRVLVVTTCFRADGPGYSPVCWRQTCGSSSHGTSGLKSSRPRHGGGGRPPAPGFPRPGQAVIAVGGEEGLGSGLHPPDNEPHRCGVGLLEGGAGGLGHIGGAVHPVRDGRPVRVWPRSGSAAGG